MKKKSLKKAAFPELEEELERYVDEMAASNSSVSSQSIRVYAKYFAKEVLEISEKDILKFSNRWLHGFLNRMGYSSRTMHGEDGGAADTTTDEMITLIAEIRSIRRQYRPDDVYNFDEIGLLYKQAPTKTYSKDAISGKKKKK
jgi:hypothetical protein